MSVRMCAVCDDPIERGEPRSFIGSLAIHEYCDPEVTGKTCDTENCAWRWTVHAGEHVV